MVSLQSLCPDAPMDLKAINTMKSEAMYTKSLYNICIMSLALIWAKWVTSSFGTCYPINLFPAGSTLTLLIYCIPYITSINFASSSPVRGCCSVCWRAVKSPCSREAQKCILSSGMISNNPHHLAHDTMAWFAFFLLQAFLPAAPRHWTSLYLCLINLRPLLLSEIFSPTST